MAGFLRFSFGVGTTDTAKSGGAQRASAPGGDLGDNYASLGGKRTKGHRQEVEEDKYSAFGALNKHVITELNALAPFSVPILPVKTAKRATEDREACG